MSLARGFELLFVAGASLVAGMAVAAWIMVGLEPGEELALAAGGLTAATLAAAAAVPLRRALARGRRVEAEIERAEERLRSTVAAGAEQHSAELERMVARA